MKTDVKENIEKIRDMERIFNRLGIRSDERLPVTSKEIELPNLRVTKNSIIESIKDYQPHIGKNWLISSTISK